LEKIVTILGILKLCFVTKKPFALKWFVESQTREWGVGIMKKALLICIVVLAGCNQEVTEEVNPLPDVVGEY